MRRDQASARPVRTDSQTLKGSHRLALQLQILTLSASALPFPPWFVPPSPPPQWQVSQSVQRGVSRYHAAQRDQASLFLALWHVIVVVELPRSVLLVMRHFRDPAPIFNNGPRGKNSNVRRIRENPVIHYDSPSFFIFSAHLAAEEEELIDCYAPGYLTSAGLSHAK
jgi:hypothetical protein